MKTINLKRIVVVFYAIVITAALFAGLNYGSEGRAIQNKDQLYNLFNHATLNYSNGDTDFAFDEMNRGLSAAFSEGTITSSVVDEVFNEAIAYGGDYKNFANAYLPTAIANGWASGSSSTTTSNV